MPPSLGSLALLALLALLSWPEPVQASSSTCYFPQEKMALTLEETRECLRSIPFNQAVAIQTVGNVIAYLQSFVFLDLLHDPPSPYEELKTDMLSCVKELQARVKASPTAFDSDYDFQQALSDIFMPYRDPHTMYSKPSAYQKFTWLLPLTLRSEYSEGKQSLYIDHLPPEYRYYESMYWEKDGVPANFYGRRVTMLNGSNDPVEALAMWADNHVYHSKSRDSRFNSALNADFWMMTGRYYGVPKDGFITIGTSETDEWTIQWGATNKIALYGTEDFASYYKILDVPWSEEARLVMNTATIVKDDEPKAREGEETKDGRVLGKYSPMRALAQEESSYYARSFTDGETPHLRRLLSTSDISFYLYEPEGLDPEDNKDVVILLNIPSFSPDDVDGFVDSFLEGINICNELGITHLIVNLMGNGGGWVTLGYRVLRVIAPWIYPVYGRYNIRTSPLADILLDSALSEEVQTHYIPDQNVPYGDSSWYTKSVKHSWKGFEGCGANGESKSGYDHDYSQRYFFTLAYDEHDFVDAFDKLDNSSGFHYSRSATKGALPAQNIIFLSDGLCGSTCACTSKRAQEAHAGVVVGVGGIVGSDLINMDVASFAGGSVSDNTYMEEYLTADDYSVDRGIPYPMPTDAVFRFAFEEVFGWEDADTPLEFHPNSVDLKVNYWPQAGSLWLEDAGTLVKKLVDEVFSRFNDGTGNEAPATTTECLSWMVTQSDACKIDNGRGGYPCRADGNGYDTSSPCKVYMCDAGYYRDEGGNKCLPIPPISDKPNNGDDDDNDSAQGLSGGAIAAIVVCSVLVVALIVIAILFWKGIITPCCGSKKGAKPLVTDTSSSQ